MARSSASCGSIASGSQPASRSNATYSSALRASATHATALPRYAAAGSASRIGGDVGDRDRPARPNDARHLGDRPRLVGERAQRAFGERDVEAGVAERQGFGVADQEARALADARRVPRLRDRTGAEVDADRLAVQFAREKERGGSLAAGDVDDALTRRDAGQLRETQAQLLPARVELAAEQPEHLVALVELRAAGLQVIGQQAGHAIVPATRSARTCLR
jgi:hypothetical protein